MVSVALSLLLGACMSADGPEWSPDVFDYNRPPRLQVREETEATESAIAGARQQRLWFKDLNGEEVPVLITLPARGRAPFPAVVLVHGFASTKEQVTRQAGPALIQRGLACVAVDLPMHGGRKGPPQGLFDDAHPRQTYERLVQAVTDIRQTLDLLERRKELDTSSGVYLAGYSMGGWLGALAGAAERRICGMVLMVPVAEAAPLHEPARGKPARTQKALLERFPALRPAGAVAHFRPRPLLLQAGSRDVYLPRDVAENLHAAAGEPRELRWYDAGHILPEKAMTEAAEWIAARLKAGRRPSR